MSLFDFLKISKIGLKENAGINIRPKNYFSNKFILLSYRKSQPQGYAQQ
jgi:hypothetical protein